MKIKMECNIINYSDIRYFKLDTAALRLPRKNLGLSIKEITLPQATLHFLILTTICLASTHVVCIPVL